MVYALVQALIILIVSESYLVEAAKDYIPPKITFPNSTDRDFYFTGNKTAIIICLAAGNPKPTFKWLQNDTEIKPTRDLIYNEKSGALEIAHFSMNQETTYRCVATNQYGHVSVSTMSPKIHLWQMRLEKFASSAEEIHDVTEYQYLKLPCADRKASKVPKLNSIWYSANKLDNLNMAAGRLYVDHDGALHFTSVLLVDNQHVGYICGISTDLADNMNYVQLGTKHIVRVKKASYTLSTGIPPRFEYSNTVVKAIQNSTAMLECVYSGYGGSPFPTQWWTNALHEPYRNSLKMKISKDGRQLFIHNVQEVDEMFYYCKAKSPKSEEITAVFMNVTSGPIFINGPPKDQIALENSTVEFNCEARSLTGENPPPPVLWFINGKKVAQNYEWSLACKKFQSFGDDEMCNFLTRELNVTVLEHYPPIVDWGKFEFTHDNKILQIKKLRKPQDVMCVQCQVENDVDVLFATACLDVLLPITITKAPKRTQEIKYGDKIDLTVILSTDEILPLQYVWSMPNRKFDEKHVPDFMSWDPINKTAIIDTSKMNIADYGNMIEGKYQITVFTQLQNVSVEFEVKSVDNNDEDPEKSVEQEGGVEYSWMMYLSVLLAAATIVSFSIICLAIKAGEYKSKGQEEQEDHNDFLTSKQ